MGTDKEGISSVRESMIRDKRNELSENWKDWDRMRENPAIKKLLFLM